MRSSKLTNRIKIFFLVLVTAVSIFPFVLMVIMTTHSTEEIYTGLNMIPGKDLIINLQNVIGRNFFVAFRNSVVVSVTVTVGAILVSSMVGYALVAYQFRAREFIYNFVLLTMMIPGSVGLIGFMYEMRVIGLSRTILPLMLGWFASGFGSFWMTQYLRSSFQISLVESARIDGCNELRLFFYIVLPCVQPALVTLGLMIFLWSWNAYLSPLILVNNAANTTIPLFIQGLGTEYRNDYAAQITGLVLGIAPILTLFALGSKSFIKGLTAGAIKG
jgi:ABC-type glycerol-3-phosphate transport system permease component